MDIWRILASSVLLLFLTDSIRCQNKMPPVVNGSYRAIGEMVETLEDESGILTQVAFEESFDADNQNAAFRVWVLGMNVTFVENFKTNQTFRYNGTDCALLTVDEWVRTKSPPSLLAYEDSNGTVRFSLKQLFSLDNKYLQEFNVSSTFRGIPARKWMYSLSGRDQEGNTRRRLSVYEYWSDGSWQTTSSSQTVPLGFVVTKFSYVKGKAGVKLHEQFINIFSFIPDIIDPKLFEPIQGVVCENRTQTLAFPDVKNIKSLALHSEVLIPDSLEIRYVDTFLDTQNKLLRMDMERIKDDKPIFEKRERKYQSDTVIGPMGIAFRLTYDAGKFSCQVISLEDFDLDVQNLYNLKLPPKSWTVEKLFGGNDTKYVYIGKTSKRDIPCHMFQGKRKDWPEPEANVTSLWEWCFSINMTKQKDIVIFRNGDFGLVQAQVKVLESTDNSFFYPDLKLIHHFYHVHAQDPAVISPTNFDISRCFAGFEKRYLQFTVDWGISDDNVHLVENATSDSGFLQKWKNMIYQHSGLQPYTLRVAKVQAIIEDSLLYIKFIILAPHSGLPAEIKKTQKSSLDAEKAFRDRINAGRVFISHCPERTLNLLKINAVKHSLKLQTNYDFKPHTDPPISTTTQSTSTKFELKTEKTSTVKSTSTSTTTKVPPSTASSTTTKVPPSTASSTTKPTTNSATESSTTNSTTGSSATNPTGTLIDTSPGGSTITSDLSSSTLPTKEELKRNIAGHNPGVVASVSIAMLLVGFTIGSAGIFVKFNGLPACLKPSS